MKIYVLASGGGHTGYAVAIGEALRDIEPDLDIAFIVHPDDIWSLKRIYRRLGGQEIVFITKPRRPLEGVSRIILRGPRAFIESLRLVREPYMVIATGSNHGVSPVIAGFLKRARYLFSIEAIDRIYTYSKANMLLYRRFRVNMLLHWIDQRRNYPRGIVVGPVYEKPVHRVRNEGYVLVLSGSMGHRRLFDLLLETDLENVVIQTGKIDPGYILARKPHWKAFRFDPDIDWWIAGAEVVIGHQGLAVAEAALAYGKPVVVAYNPDLPQTSGRMDSMLLAKKLNGVYIDVGRASSHDLVEAIEYARKRKPPRYINGAYTFARTITGMLYR